MAESSETAKAMKLQDACLKSVARHGDHEADAGGMAWEPLLTPAQLCGTGSAWSVTETEEPLCSGNRC